MSNETPLTTTQSLRQSMEKIDKYIEEQRSYMRAIEVGNKSKDQRIEELEIALERKELERASYERKSGVSLMFCVIWGIFAFVNLGFLIYRLFL